MTIPVEPSDIDSVADRTIEEFRSCASPAERRVVLCRYLRHGSEVGASQAELIDLLGVSTPSILDRAGYTDDLAMQVMDSLGTLTDDEIAGTGRP